MLRTHTCGELKANDIGKEVTLCGWVASRRDHGKLIFIDIRDRQGLTQVVFIPKESGEAYKLAQDLRSEFVSRKPSAGNN
jgi:aspartyl-tRNA synthetase